TTLALGALLSQNANLVRQKKMTVDAWRSDSARQIALTLKGLVQDELFRAEAVASLTPQQRQGLFSFLQTIQEDLRRESGGSREAARRRIEEEGLTTEEYLRRREELALIGEQLHTKVTRRVNVTWRDISQAYYGRMYDKYNPPVRYLYRLIIVDGADEAAKSEVASQLAAGKPFAEVAALPLNGSRAATGGMQTPRDVEGDPKAIKFFPNADLDAAAHSLSPGQTSEPIKVGSQVAWLHFDSIEDKKQSIYDAQLEIYATIFNTRLGFEQNKYYNQLLSHASVTSLIEMQNRLLQIAEERYLRGGIPRPQN
ncbi:MAG: peptidylprolyl isomerase, partial [Phycisphaerales bacterium]